MPVVQHAFAGIRICVCVLILQAIVKLWKKSVVDKLSFLLYLIVFFFAGFSAILPFKVPAAVLVIAAGVFGIFFGKSGQDSSAPEKTKEGKA